MLTFDPNTIELPKASFVHGEFKPGRGDELKVVRPSDGAVSAVLREDNEEDVGNIVTIAHETYRKSGWGTCDPRQRGAVLRKWADLVDKNREELSRLESLGSSRPITSTHGRDVVVAAEVLRYFGECADKSYGDVLNTARSNFFFTEYEPYGVIGAISPWNVPLVLAMAKAAPAIAAGNAVVLKPSELTPFSALRVAELGVAAGLPKGLLNVVIGRGQITGNALVRHPLVRYITFTGSTATGAAIMAEAAHAGLKPVSMELGGKSPQIVFSDAPDLEKVAGFVANGFAHNSGQICFAGTRLIVEESVRERLLELVTKVLTTYQHGPTWEETTTLPPIISVKQAERIEALVGQGLKSGARLYTGGNRIDRNDVPFIEPTILTDVESSNIVVREEIFGPVLTVQTFRTPAEAMQLADHPQYGLAASIYTSDINKALLGARSVEAGTVWINSHGRGMDISSPFGGYKQSGFGKDFGLAGFDKYRRSKSINISLSEVN